MSTDYFQFKKFTVHHHLCAMKVGTDGVLLGALAEGGKTILDIGTGTGLVALMMAQRFPSSQITGIDIDYGATVQAKQNISSSPFAERIHILKLDLAEFVPDVKYDSIVCNPPFFENEAVCRDSQRTIARHTQSLPYSILVSKVADLLEDKGVFTIIIPTDSLKRIEEECAYSSLFISRQIFIRTTERKSPKRVVLYITKQNNIKKEVITHCLTQNGARSEWYSKICGDFYL